MDEDLFNGSALLSGIVVTLATGLCLVLTPPPVAFVVLVALAFACGWLGGRDAGLGSVATGGLIFPYAITPPHFVWVIRNDTDVVLLIVLFVGSLIASELGVRIRRRARTRS